MIDRGPTCCPSAAIGLDVIHSKFGMQPLVWAVTLTAGQPGHRGEGEAGERQVGRWSGGGWCVRLAVGPSFSVGPLDFE